jgi:hypothetical protein
MRARREWEVGERRAKNGARGNTTYNNRVWHPLPAAAPVGGEGEFLICFAFCFILFFSLRLERVVCVSCSVLCPSPAPFEGQKGQLRVLGPRPLGSVSPSPLSLSREVSFPSAFVCYWGERSRVKGVSLFYIPATWVRRAGGHLFYTT